MDLYEVTYKRRLVEEPLVDYDGLSYTVIARASDLETVEKFARPWLLAKGINLDDLFPVQAIKLDITHLPQTLMNKGYGNSFEDDSLFI